jgi:hypothetical protein
MKSSDSGVVRCPRCHDHDIEQVARSLAGRRFSCHSCGLSWGISLEDEILGMIGIRGSGPESFEPDNHV